MNRSLTTYAAAVGAVAIFSTANAGLLYEPDSYALQDNLVVNFDGIRNAGLLKAHDNNATKWKSIGRVPNDATLISKSGDTSAWVADGYHFAGGTLGKLKSNQNFGSQMTVQIVCDVRGSESSSTWPTFFGNPNDYANIYFSNKDTGLIHFKADRSTGLSGNARATVTASQITYLNAALDVPAHKQILVTSDSFVNGWKTGTITATNYVATQTWTFGSAGTDQNGYNQRYLVGTIKAIRVYDRVLSNAELAANRALDNIRFFTGIPVTNVVVATSIAGVEGNESSGVYAYDDSGYTFTAPQKATKDGVVYSCAGYTLETWNGSSWSSPVSYASCSCTATDTKAKVRLTWQWARAHAAVTTDLDPLFDNYVTDGLVFHLDGIRNVGADKPHDSSSSEWIDLAKGRIGSLQHDFVDFSTWTEDGYYFGGRSFAQFEPYLTGLTNTVTVQVVCDTTTNALAKFKTSRDPWVLWPNMVSLGDNDGLNIYYDMNRSTPYIPVFKSANGGNTYMPANIWEGRYVTAMRNGNKHYILQTTNIADAASVTHSQGNITTEYLRVGSGGSGIGKREQRWFLGTIKATGNNTRTHQYTQPGKLYG